MNTDTLKLGKDLAAMLKGGVIMDVTTAEEAKIAEEAGAVSVMALERIPADIRKEGGVARMSDPELIIAIKESVSIPVMAKVRIGHTMEARVLESLAIDFIDESEVLTIANPFRHVVKRDFSVPFVCGATNLGEALRRIDEGAAMIRTKGEAGTGNVVEAVRHLESIKDEIDDLQHMMEGEIVSFATEQRVPVDLVNQVREAKRLPVVTFVAGGIATPADAALMMSMGAEGVFVGSGIFKSSKPLQFAKAIVQATTHFTDPGVVAEVSKGLGSAMSGQLIEELDTRLQDRGH